MSDEHPLEFVDTNVLVYAHDASANEKHRRAVELIEALIARGSGALSVQVLQEFFVTVTAKVSRPLPARTAAAVIADLGSWAVHAPEVGDVLAAIDVHRRHRVSFWDALILRSASRLGCAVLWSEDLDSGRIYDGVEVRNPFHATRVN